MPYKDKRKQSEYQNQWMQNRRVAWLEENGPCVKCGSKEKLQVDHVDPKQKVSHRIWSWSDGRRLEELAKCEVLCEKCHSEKSIFDRNHLPARHGSKVMYNYGCRCADCSKANAVACKAYRERKKQKQ